MNSYIRIYHSYSITNLTIIPISSFHTNFSLFYIIVLFLLIFYLIYQFHFIDSYCLILIFQNSFQIFIIIFIFSLTLNLIFQATIHF